MAATTALTTSPSATKKKKQARVCVYGPPDLHAAIRTCIAVGAARVVMLLPLSRDGLAPDWAITVAADEYIAARSSFKLDDIEGKPLAVAALIVNRSALPLLRLDEQQREAIAAALAQAMLQEVK